MQGFVKFVGLNPTELKRASFSCVVFFFVADTHVYNTALLVWSVHFCAIQFVETLCAHGKWFSLRRSLNVLMYTYTNGTYIAYIRIMPIVSSRLLVGQHMHTPSISSSVFVCCMHVMTSTFYSYWYH